MPEKFLYIYIYIFVLLNRTYKLISRLLTTGIVVETKEPTLGRLQKALDSQWPKSKSRGSGWIMVFLKECGWSCHVRCGIYPLLLLSVLGLLAMCPSLHIAYGLAQTCCSNVEDDVCHRAAGGF